MTSRSHDPLHLSAAGYVLGIDLGGTHLRLAIADLDGTIRARGAEAIDPTAGPEPLLARIVEAGLALLAASGGAPLTAAALATPGLVDAGRGVVRVARNLGGWRDVAAGAVLAEGFGVPVAVENDVNLAAAGERWRGAARGVDDVVFVAVGTGIGAGIIAGGELVRGHRFAAGEIGFMPSGYPAEGSEGEAWLEDIAGGPAIVRRAKARGVRATDGGELTTDHVFAAARSGDPAAMAVIGEAVDALARGVAALVAVADPAIVVIGGGVSEQGDALIEPLRARLGQMTRSGVRVERSALGVDAQLYGAVWAALRATERRGSGESGVGSRADEQVSQ